MGLDPRTPVLVGVGSITEHGDDPAQLRDAVELLVDAARAAESDSGTTGLLRRAQLVAVPNGTWRHPNPPAALVAAVGADARTLVAEVGITQQALLSRAATAIQRGDLDVVVVGGTEAKHRERLLARTGAVEVQPDAPRPHELWLPDGDILTRAEIERHLAVPAHQYALVERLLDIGPDRLGALWSSFASVAAVNPDAWDRSNPSAAEIVTPSARNRLIAEPYTRLLCSQWNVDQAVALVLTSAERADDVGVQRDRWVFPVAAAGSDLMVPMPARRDLDRWPAFALAAEGALGAAGTTLDDVALVDLYSCFPAAVQVQARELGLALDSRPLTVTGGMTFAGGPLNSYVLHAVVTLARQLRDQPSAMALSTSGSGMLTKPGVGLWSASPPAAPFRHVDVTAPAAEGTAVVPFAPDATGGGTVVTATTLHAGGDPYATVAIVELADGSRTVATAEVGAPTEDGSAVTVPAPGTYLW